MPGPDEAISQLPAASALTGSEIMPLVQAAADVSVTLSTLRSFIGGGPPSGAAGGVLAGTYPNPAALSAAGNLAVEGAVGNVYNVLNHGLVADYNPNTLAGTDNSGPLQTLINSIPRDSNARFEWPVGTYVFRSAVEWADRSIYNIGLGGFTGGNNFPLDSTALYCGANNMAIFTVTGGLGGSGSSTSQYTPSFENMTFASDGTNLTNVVGLKIVAAQRVHLTNVMFDRFTQGVWMDMNTAANAGNDCAWHSWRNVKFHNCKTGLYSPASNSWSWLGGECTSCAIGIDIQAGNALSFGGVKFNLMDVPTAVPSELSGLPCFGARLGVAGAAAGVYASYFQFAMESNQNGPKTFVQVNGDSGSPNVVSGSGNTLILSSMHSGGFAANIGLDLAAGSNDNIYMIPWHVFSAANVVHDAGIRNVPIFVEYQPGPPMQGTGAPNGVVAAFIGQQYVNLSGGASTTLYVKESGAGTNTGWIAK